MLELRGITKAYTTASLTQVALDSVDLAFRDNEFVAILGQSGSGKTTMLNIVGGLDHFDSGDLVIDSISTKDYRDRDWDAYRNNRIGFVFQSYNLIPHQSVLGNVELALTLSGVSPKERKRRALDALERVGLAEHVGKRPSQLSGGQMQRVAIARALINDPEIVLADEPTGALDSKTSVQVMDLLREVARDRLVIMVTHNPELAERYATRIVELADGKILSDSRPFIPGAKDRREGRAAKRTSMSPLTALSLSGKNLLTKKGRTLMTSFAGSIGIIGIAAILALANGVNAYIAATEEDALTSYPLSITESGVDMSAMMESAVRDAQTVSAQSGKVAARPAFAAMAQSRSKNDLASLKTYFDADGGRIFDHVAAIEYAYGAKPLVYREDTSKGIVRLNPDQAFSTLSTASRVSPFSSYIQMDAFTQLPANAQLYEDAYTVLAGSWPKDAHDLVLVVDSDRAMSDLLEYTLGLKDHAELDELMESYYSGAGGPGRAAEDASGDEGGTDDAVANYDYDSILGTSFSLVPASSLYTYDSEHAVWVDRSEDRSYMSEQIAKGQTLTVTGIVAAKEADTTIIGQGLAYTPELTEEVMRSAASSDIVKAQIADPLTDVFTGKRFDELDDATKPGFDLSSLFTIDPNALRTAFRVDPNALQMDLSGLDLSALDLSAIDPGAFSMPGLDLSALGNTDLSSAIDPSTIAPADLDLAGLAARYPELGEIDWASIVSKALSEGAIPPTAGQALAGTSAEIIQGFLDYYAAHSDTDGDGAPDADPLGLATAYISSPEVRARLEEALDSGEVVNAEVLSAKLATALGEDRALREVASRASAELAESIGRSLATQLATALSSQISQMISDSLSQTMAKAMSQMMTQIQNAIALQMERAMGGFASSLASAFTVDESAFAQAFRTNTDPEDLQRLLSTMMSTTPTTYDTNLTKLGWADPDAPSQINIYPTTFADKDAVKAIIEVYNEAATAAGDGARVVAYTDMVGLLMSSVTRIIDIIKWMLIAFVSISLVVSSIMIAIITLISVLERKKEIGILRSIGASKKDISRVFNAETFIVGLLAGLIGVGITLVLTLIANVIVEAKLEVADIAQLPVSAGAILIAVSIILTLIAGLLPARKAAKEDPVEALRSE
ncbi:ATP-binding cassette domain-containing protein [Schaalia hyovaginalis]|uniref:ATP-binding cassette domain-containing protein n=1 Tax=Schaalia hyovaginalis TaxID=29316 RepID=UPI0026EC209A|nr:ATP-binding cassette domain-containing protein [Schaalia hyovaginalis]MDD7555040.1 ATP-binding cassette domain-containing protein [Schaalia hyovaginalis]MDY3093096.1 ATP-binding cassette domain-containing protein [Schaalia hyovaginalis]